MDRRTNNSVVAMYAQSVKATKVFPLKIIFFSLPFTVVIPITP